MRHYAIAIGFILALLVSGATYSSEIYKWVDDEGNVHFGDRPDGVQPERLDIESRPTDPARVQAMNQARATERAKSETAKAQAAAEQPTAEEVKKEADERTAKCTAYQAQLQSYTNNRRLYRMDADGEREYLSDDEVDQTRQVTAQRVEEFCN